MKVEIKIPTLGESVSEAIISRIIKPSGSMVVADEEILELETDKVNQVLYAPQAGQLHLNVKVEETVKVGQVIGSVDTSVQGAAEAPKPAPQKETKQPEAGSARKMTQEFVAGLKSPSKEPASPPPSVPAPKVEVTGDSTRKRMTSLRKTIAQKLVEAKNQTAMLTTFNEIDLSKVIEIRTKEKDRFLEKHGAKLGFMSFFTKAVVHALKTIPAVNSMIDGDEIVTFNTYDIGIAVSTDKGLFVPVIRGCDTLSFGEIEVAIAAMAKKARSGSIALSDLKGGSFTITNAGSFGSLLSTPILNPPQSAVLGMHNIVKRPVVVDDQIVIRPMMYVALSYDHRIIDGKEAVTFLVNIKENLEDPTRLLFDL